MGRWFSTVCALSVTFLISACSVNPGLPSHSAPDPLRLSAALSGEGLGIGVDDGKQMSTAALFTLTPEMKQFAERAVAPYRGAESRVKALHEALLKPMSHGGAGLRYESYLTGTPAEAFESGSVNCVSFTLLFVSMAHHVGINALYNEVDIPTSWDMRNADTFLLLRHINSKVRVNRGDYLVVDLEMSRYRATYEQRTITSDLAAAQFFNNRAMELSAEGDLIDSFLYLRKVLLLNDQRSYIWSNLGTLLRRADLLEESEAVYLKGLSIDGSDLSIMQNLSGLYRRMGKPEQAAEYAQLAEVWRNKNPFYQYREAMILMQQGDLVDARTRIQQAIKMEKNEPLFYELAANIYLALDEREQADRMLEKSRELRVIHEMI